MACWGVEGHGVHRERGAAAAEDLANGNARREGDGAARVRRKGRDEEAYRNVEEAVAGTWEPADSHRGSAEAEAREAGDRALEGGVDGHAAGHHVERAWFFS